MTSTEPRPVYAVAGRAMLCDLPIPALAPLRSDRRPDFAIRRRALALPSSPPVFDGDARVGNRCCWVRTFATPDGDFLQISGAGAFAISRGEARIDLDPEPGAEEGAVVEALLGPALALALARRGIFVLHASAVVLQGQGAVGFLGDSGAGKSTLARLLAAAGEEVALAADDLLAIEEGAAALPHFPQLKLDAAAMAAIAGLEPRYPLLALYALAPAPPAAAVEAGEPLPPASAAALLVHHTVASILFAGDLLAAHFDFMADLASRVPLRPLSVPRRTDIGAEVLRALH